MTARALDDARALRGVIRELARPGSAAECADRRIDAADAVHYVARRLGEHAPDDRADLQALIDYIGVAGSDLRRPQLRRAAEQAQARLWQRHAPVTAGGDDA
jgi:hypothetical protein